MTKQEAKELALEMCDYYLAHDNCVTKEDLSQELKDKLYDLINGCPLCKYVYYALDDCYSCPLVNVLCNSVWNRKDNELMKKFRKLIARW